MSDSTSSFSVLPWTVPKTLQNFVPECSRIFVKKDCSIYICWRGSSSVLFTFRCRFENLSSQAPIYSQAIICKDQILDIIEVDHAIFFVSHTSLFLTLNSQGRHSWEILNNLGDCKSFFLEDAFELSPLKIIKSVITFPVTSDASLRNYFVAITHSEVSHKVDAELYSVSHGSSVKCQLHAVICINSCAPIIEKCFSTFLTDDQAASYFCDLKDAKILLVGLDICQLYCLPIYISEKKCGIKPSAKLIYQSAWPVVGISCPEDGFSIYLHLEGGTVVNISPLDNKPGRQDQPSLSYSSFTLSYPIRCLAAPKYDVFFVSDAIFTSEVHIVTSSQVDIQTIPVKGITSLITIPNTSLVLATTFHNSFYLLHPLNFQKKSEDISPAWAGCSLDVSLQLVEDMKVQTQMLSLIRQELQEESRIINALSTVARAHLLADHFSISAKISGTFREQERREQDREILSDGCVFQISIEIRNSSPEEFDPFLWLMCIDVKNLDGQRISKNVPLSRAFNKNFPFSTVLNIPYRFGKFCFPVYVVASLIGSIKDKNSKSQWLKIRLNEVALDVSHFFTVSINAPQQGSRPAFNILEFINHLKQQDDASSDAQRNDLKRKALLTSYTIPIPEEYRKPDIIVEKLLSNCEHNQKLLIERDFYNQSEKTVIWLYILHETVQLVFRKSCASISISCCDLDLLHAVKLSLATMFLGDVSKPLVDDSRVSASVNDAHCKARNINAVLETLSLEEVKDVNQLLNIYQDLRNNVSSQKH